MIVAFMLHDGPAAALPAVVFAANAGVAAKRSKATVHSVFRDMVDLLVLGVGRRRVSGHPNSPRLEERERRSQGRSLPPTTRLPRIRSSGRRSRSHSTILLRCPRIPFAAWPTRK